MLDKIVHIGMQDAFEKGSLRVLCIVMLTFHSLWVSSQETRRRQWYKNDIFISYVTCNGQRVSATYCVRNINDVFIGCENYSQTAVDTTLSGSIVVPSHVAAPDGQVFRVIGVSRHAFADCRRLTEVVLPDSIHDIGDQSFMNCRSLRQIVLPPATSFLWPYAFRGCSSLRQVDVRAAVPPDAYNDVFDEHTLRFATLVIPAAHAEAYRNAFVWNMFRYSIPNFDR